MSKGISIQQWKELQVPEWKMRSLEKEWKIQSAGDYRWQTLHHKPKNTRKGGALIGQKVNHACIHDGVIVISDTTVVSSTAVGPEHPREV